MTLHKANYCIGDAGKYDKPDMYLCSLLDRIAGKFLRKEDIDLLEEGVYDLRLFGTLDDDPDAKNSKYRITKPIERIIFAHEGSPLWHMFILQVAPTSALSGPSTPSCLG